MTALKPRTASVVIYQGDDLEQIADLRRAAEVAARAEALEERRAGDESSAQVAKDAHDAFVEQAADRAIVVHLQMLGRRKFRDLMAEHKPREGNEEDAQFGVNVDGFADAFLPLSIASVEPETPADREAFLDNLSAGDFDRLFVTAYYLNRAPGSDPREGRYSSAPRSSAAI